MWKPILFVICAAIASAQQYTSDGQLMLPKDYTQWTYITTSVGMSYPEEGPPGKAMFGNLFVNPKALESYRNTGTWPDKTVLLIEVRDSATKPALNKGALFQTEIMGWEAHVKDSAKGGWNFYGIGKNATSGKPLPKTAKCFECHEKNGAVDTTFVQYYPSLIETAKKKGTYKNTGE